MLPFDREKHFKTRSVAGTLAIAATIAEILPSPRVVILRGDLGAGKTTLAKGWVQALGAGRADDVTSPTFTLVHEYRGTHVTVYHLDLYRLETERELVQLGLDELFATPNALVLVEWGERFPSVADRADAEIAVTALDGDERAMHIRWHER